MLFIIITHALMIEGVLWLTRRFARAALVPPLWTMNVNLPGIAAVPYLCAHTIHYLTFVDLQSATLWPIVLVVVAVLWAICAIGVLFVLSLWLWWRRSR